MPRPRAQVAGAGGCSARSPAPAPPPRAGGGGFGARRRSGQRCRAPACRGEGAARGPPRDQSRRAPARRGEGDLADAKSGCRPSRPRAQRLRARQRPRCAHVRRVPPPSRQGILLRHRLPHLSARARASGLGARTRRWLEGSVPAGERRAGAAARFGDPEARSNGPERSTERVAAAQHGDGRSARRSDRGRGPGPGRRAGSRRPSPARRGSARARPGLGPAGGLAARRHRPQQRSGGRARSAAGFRPGPLRSVREPQAAAKQTTRPGARRGGRQASPAR